jgi:hypothetical protein
LEHSVQSSPGADHAEDSIDKIWLVVRSLKTAEGKYDYKINKFDVIKLGRVKFRVKDFHVENHHANADEVY